MFLVIGSMPHEAVWTEWFSQLADKVPAQIACSDRLMRCLQQMGSQTKHSVYDAQHLFTIQVHPTPDFPGYPPGSIFAGRELLARAKVCPFIRHDGP